MEIFGKASASGAELEDLQHFVGDGAGIMPVCIPKQHYISGGA